MRKCDIKIFDIQTIHVLHVGLSKLGLISTNFAKPTPKFLNCSSCILFHSGYDEAAIEELRLNEGKQLLNDLKDSVENGRSLDIQDENGATAVSY